MTPLELAALPAPTPELVLARIRELGMTYQALGELLRIAPRTLQRYVQPITTERHTPCPFPVWAVLCSLSTTVQTGSTAAREVSALMALALLTEQTELGERG